MKPRAAAIPSFRCSHLEIEDGQAVERRNGLRFTGGVRIDRVVPNLTVRNREELEQSVSHHVGVLGMTVLMDHGWITTLGDDQGHQLSVMTRDATAPVNPDVSVFVDDVHAALEQAEAAGLEIVHPLTHEAWGVTRFFYRDAGGDVINIGTHS